jgi:hypothetical protein
MKTTYQVEAGCTNGNPYEGTGRDQIHHVNLPLARAAAMEWLYLLKTEQCPRGEQHEVSIWEVRDDERDHAETYSTTGPRP